MHTARLLIVKKLRIQFLLTLTMDWILEVRCHLSGIIWSPNIYKSKISSKRNMLISILLRKRYDFLEARLLKKIVCSHRPLMVLEAAHPLKTSHHLCLIWNLFNKNLMQKWYKNLIYRKKVLDVFLQIR